MLDPLGSFLQRTRFQPAGAPLRRAAAPDQTGALQHLQVLGDGRQAHVEGFRQFTDRGLARGEPGEDRASGRIGERGKGGVETIGRHVLF
jgi:hypothetical protein